MGHLSAVEGTPLMLGLLASPPQPALLQGSQESFLESRWDICGHCSWMNFSPMGISLPKQASVSSSSIHRHLTAMLDLGFFPNGSHENYAQGKEAFALTRGSVDSFLLRLSAHRAAPRREQDHVG